MKKVFFAVLPAAMLSACGSSDSGYQFSETQLAPKIENFPYAVTDFDPETKTIQYFDLKNGADECEYNAAKNIHRCSPLKSTDLDLALKAVPRLAVSKSGAQFTVFNYDQAVANIVFDSANSTVTRTYYNKGEEVFETSHSGTPAVYNHYAFSGFPVGGSESCSTLILECGNGELIGKPNTFFENGAESISVIVGGRPDQSMGISNFTYQEKPEVIPQMPAQQLVAVTCNEVLCDLNISTGELWTDNNLLETLTLEFVQAEGYYQINLPNSTHTSTEHLVWTGTVSKNGTYVEQWAKWPDHLSYVEGVHWRAVSQQAFDDIVEELSF